MKLVGSITEEKFKNELLASHAVHFSVQAESRLKNVLQRAGYQTDNAFILECVADQFDDGYLVLIGGRLLVQLEINKYKNDIDPIIEQLELNSYFNRLSRIYKIRLLVAQDLANKNIAIRSENIY